MQFPPTTSHSQVQIFFCFQTLDVLSPQCKRPSISVIQNNGKCLNTTYFSLSLLDDSWEDERFLTAR